MPDNSPPILRSAAPIFGKMEYMKSRKYLTCIGIDWKNVIVVQHSGHDWSKILVDFYYFSGCSISLFEQLQTHHLIVVTADI